MSQTGYLKAKAHYEILDGLRGVAALAVVFFHTLETFHLDDPFTHPFNHGYLAVDFFFLLSGFVVAYAYDDRWSRMSLGDFARRRIIRLQPMVVMGSIIGALLFYFQTGPAFPLVATTPVWKMLLVMLVGFTLIPLLPSMDIRGWQEMHPLNGPAWSLFFEYVANILYALVLWRLSKKVLAVLTLLAAGLLIEVGIFGPRGDVIGGWMINAAQLHIGFARLLFPFLAGMLLMRLGRRIRVPRAFTICAVLMLATYAVPRIGGREHLWQNGLYESFVIILIFPLIIAMGSGSRVTSGIEERVCRFLGDISYPIYITHYPLIYTYTAWVVRDKPSAAKGAIFGVLLFVTAIAIAYVCLRFYDKPLRRWLTTRFIGKPSTPLTVSEQMPVTGN